MAGARSADRALTVIIAAKTRTPATTATPATRDLRPVLRRLWLHDGGRWFDAEHSPAVVTTQHRLVLVVCARGYLRVLSTASLYRLDGRNGQHDETGCHGGEACKEHKGIPVSDDQDEAGEHSDSGNHRVRGQEAPNSRLRPDSGHPSVEKRDGQPKPVATTRMCRSPKPGARRAWVRNSPRHTASRCCSKAEAQLPQRPQPVSFQSRIPGAGSWFRIPTWANWPRHFI